MQHPHDELRSLSYPAPGTDAARTTLFARFVGEIQRTYVKGLLRRGSAELRSDAPELFDFLNASTTRDITCYDEPLLHHAALVASVNQRTGDLPWLLALTALSLHAAGHRRRWAVRFSRPTRVAYRGWVSPPIDEVEALDERVRFGRAFIGSVDTGDLARAGFSPLSAIGTPENVIHVVPDRFRSLVPAPVDAGLADPEVAELEAVLRDAMTLISEVSAEYVSWVHGAVRFIVPAPRPEGADRSGSFDMMPGVVVVGAPLDAVTLAELLVHEASHQYLLAARAFVRLENGRDPRRYFSPFPRAERAIAGILVGYHAFANIARFQHALSQKGALTSQRQAGARWIERFRTDLITCRDMLSHSPGLTAHGRDFWEPLAEALDQDGVLGAAPTRRDHPGHPASPSNLLS